MKAALLLIDLQRDFLEGGSGLQPPAGLLVRRTAVLLAGFRQRRLPVLHLWTTLRAGEPHRFAHWHRDHPPRCVAGSAGHDTPAPLRPFPGEGIVHKHGYNPFAESGLEARLRQAGSGTVVLAGVHLHACVRTAAVECLERGYAVIIAEDAVGTNDPIHSAAVQRWLADRCVGFQPVSELLAQLDQPTDGRLIHYSPRASNEVLFEVQPARASAVAAAVNTARDVRAQWGSTPREFRLERLARLAADLRSNARRFARQMAVEIGKPWAQGMEEMSRAAANLDDLAHRIASTPIVQPAAAWVRPRPLGVVALITPWNNPVAIPIGKLAPAIAHGNAVVWKPAPAATMLGRATLELVHAAGFPEGLVQLLEGDGATARQLTRQTGVDAVTFTGSLSAGHAIQELCATRCLPLQAELGGNNAAIVWDAVDLPAAAADLAWGAFGFAGQRCTANRRVIVPEAQCAALLEAVIEATAALRWGDPLDPDTVIGPVLTMSRRDDLLGLVAGAQADRVLASAFQPHQRARRAPPEGAGAYAPPTVVVCADPRHAIVQEESMAPLLVVQPARDFDHALELCNGVRQGLVAALFSGSAEHQQQFLEQAQAGILKLNSSTAGVDPALPFGGWKASGLGPPEHGEGDAQFYCRLQAVYQADAPASSAGRIRCQGTPRVG